MQERAFITVIRPRVRRYSDYVAPAGRQTAPGPAWRNMENGSPGLALADPHQSGQCRPQLMATCR
jgi:hypothetical protein